MITKNEIGTLLKIREATEKDIDTIVNITNEHLYAKKDKFDNGFFIKGISHESVLESINTKGNHIFIAEYDNKPVGYADVRFKNPGFGNEIDPSVTHLLSSFPQWFGIYRIAVSAKYQNQGIGSELVRRAKENLNGPLVSTIVTSPVVNTASIAFHEKNNFISIGSTSSKDMSLVVYFNN